MKILLFGVGEYYNRYKIWFSQEEVIALIDNSESKQGTMIDGIKVVSPREIIQLEFDAVFIMSFYIKTMRKQLLDLGVPMEKIHHFYDIHDLIYKPELRREVKNYGADMSESNDKGVLLLNQDLTLGGPAIALYNTAKVLKKNGYKVTYASQIDGPLRELLQIDEIPVIVDENLLVQTMNETTWLKGYTRILCNTINFHVFLSQRDTGIPMIWWLHDALFFYDGVNKKAIQSIKKENIKVCGVGPVSERAIKAFRPDFEVEDLVYGVEDTGFTQLEKKEDTVIKFVTIGYVEERKGQDVLISAIQRLPEKIRHQARFYFVGRNTSMMASELMIQCRDFAEVKFLGLVDRQEINRILEETDVLVCPSREDPMPTVCAEAMMHGVPCFVSDAAGTAKYISDGEDGLTFRSEDAEQLAQRITWAVENRDKLHFMGAKARKLFENHFSMNAFETKLIRLFGDGENICSK